MDYCGANYAVHTRYGRTGLTVLQTSRYTDESSIPIPIFGTPCSFTLAALAAAATFDGIFVTAAVDMAVDLSGPTPSSSSFPPS